MWRWQKKKAKKGVWYSVYKLLPKIGVAVTLYTFRGEMMHNVAMYFLSNGIWWVCLETLTYYHGNFVKKWKYEEGEDDFLNN